MATAISFAGTFSSNDGRVAHVGQDRLVTVSAINALGNVGWDSAWIETNPTDGKQYLTQHFERARFEYHPENAGTPYDVLLGLLGRELTGTK